MTSLLNWFWRRLMWVAASLVLLWTGTTTPAMAAEVPPALHPQLEVLRPFIGHTWRGEFKDSTPEKPVIDVSRWERILNGQAIRVLHSINKGGYGGETIVRWDAEKKEIVYHYFTTQGFMTTGTMTVEGKKYTSRESVRGDAGGVTEVKGTGEIGPDGSLRTKAEYLKNGKWEPGHEALYHEDPKAEIIFR